MEEHEATFGVESKADAYAVKRLMERLFDSLREESRTLREETGDSTETLAEFEAIRDAARNLRPGRLTVVFEQSDEDFEG